MLWAQFQPKNEAEAAGFFIGVMLAGLFSGGIPFFTGLAMKQLPLGIATGIISGLAGAFAGCCLGIPVAVVFTVIIVIVAQFAGRSPPEPQFPEPLARDRDHYARALRLPDRNKDDANIPWAKEVRDDADDDWHWRAEDGRRPRDRGHRPRRPPDGRDA